MVNKISISLQEGLCNRLQEDVKMRKAANLSERISVLVRLGYAMEEKLAEESREMEMLWGNGK